LHTFTPLLDMGSTPEEIRRNGNRHRQFIPVNAYPTSDGYVYMAIGSDSQWARLVAHPMFAHLDLEVYRSNEGRRSVQEDLHAQIAGTTCRYDSATVSAVFEAASVPHSPITPIEEVPDLPFVEEAATRTVAPDGRVVRLPPPAVAVEHLDTIDRTLPFAPAYGEHTESVLTEAGLSTDEIRELRSRGVIA
jgi:crotonobetainyl-CoA:carnitine CoA-transferase CaiB-like acyl-CoA transferase